MVAQIQKLLPVFVALCSLGGAQQAEAVFVKITSQGSSTVVNQCDSSLAQTATNCVGYAPYLIGGPLVLFSGSVGSYSFGNMLISSAAPFGTSMQLTALSVTNTGTVPSTLTIEASGFGFLATSGSISYTGVTTVGSSSGLSSNLVNEAFYLDPTNSGLQANGVYCSFAAPGSCSASGTVATTSPFYSLSFVDPFTLDPGQTVDLSVNLTAQVPEPNGALLALTGLLLMAGCGLTRAIRSLDQPRGIAGLAAALP